MFRSKKTKTTTTTTTKNYTHTSSFVLTEFTNILTTQNKNYLLIFKQSKVQLIDLVILTPTCENISELNHRKLKQNECSINVLTVIIYAKQYTTIKADL